MTEVAVNIAIIGGGPAGYSAAIRAAKLGATVCLVEKSTLGGACLNRACIPTKTLLHSLALLRSINTAASFGIDAEQGIIDLHLLREYKNKIVSIMNGGVEQMLRQNSVTVISGSASIRTHHEIELFRDNGITQLVKADSIVIATGSIPCTTNVPGFDAKDILYSNDILELKHIPESLLIVGGGVVGIELASIMAGLGVRVSVLEIMPRILSGEDSETVHIFEQALRKSGVKIFAGAEVVRLETIGHVKRIHFRCGDSSDSLDAESVCIAIGQKPFIEGLSLDGCGVKSGAHGIEVDVHMRTSVPNIFAAGDVTGNLMLAYVAMAEGRIAAENALGRETVMAYTAVPRCIYGTIELASVGLTESQAATNAIKVNVVRSTIGANAAAAILGEKRGLVKIVTDLGGKIIGAQIAGKGASELIAECALAVKLGASITDLRQTLHPHPTLSESIWEAALNDNN